MAKKREQLLAAFVMGYCFITLFSGIATADTPREIAKRVSPSVLLLVMEDSSGQPLAMGSGFVVREGIVATNMHVIEGAARGYAKLADQKDKHDIRGVVATDSARDLVLLAVDGVQANPLTIGDSDQVAVGDEVYAVGNPRGLEGTFSAGIVSSVRKVGDDSLLQITAPISPGSSGGPVVNGNGQVIGVAVATFKGGQNLNFAIPSSYVTALIPLIKTPVAFSEASKASKGTKDKSILDDMGGRSTDGVEASDFLWTFDWAQGQYSLSLRNKLPEPVKNVMVAVIFHNEKGEVLDFDIVNFEGTIPGGLAKRVKSQVEDSVQELTSKRGSKQPWTKLEYRVLYFDIASSDDPADQQSQNLPTIPIAPKIAKASEPKQFEESLADLERKMAEAVAKFAPAGSGADLIESQIEGDFEGWDGETIFELANGQIWQQVSYAYTYHYAFRPKVMIIKTHGAYKMQVDGVSGTIFVMRIK